MICIKRASAYFVFYVLVQEARISWHSSGELGRNDCQGSIYRFLTIGQNSELPSLGVRVACSDGEDLSVACTNVGPIGGTALFILWFGE